MKHLNKCPCCESTFSVVSDYQRTFIFRVNKEWNEFSGFLYLCNFCGHLYVDHSIDEVDLTSHYEQKYSPSLGAISDIDLKEYSDIVKSLLPFFNTKSIQNSSSRSALEIGPGDGAFLQVLKSNLFETHFHDLSSDVTSKLSCLHSYHKAGNKYDLIVLRHVLEHILEPRQFLQSILDTYMHENSLIHIEIPIWDLLDEFTDPLMPEHIHQFTSSSFNLLVKCLGMEIKYSSLRRTPGFSTTPNWRLVTLLSQNNSKFKNLPIHYLQNFYESRDKSIHKFLHESNTLRFAFHGASSQLADFISNNRSTLDKDFLIIDGNSNRLGEDFLGFKLDIPSAHHASNLDVILCFSSYSDEIESNWRTLGFKGQFIIAWK